MSDAWIMIISAAVGRLKRQRAVKFDENPVHIAGDRRAEGEYAAMCEKGETINAVCRGYIGEYYVLTDRRLIIDNKWGFHSIPFDTIRRVEFYNAIGLPAARTALDCHAMAVYADRKHSLARYSARFDQIAAPLFKRYDRRIFI